MSADEILASEARQRPRGAAAAIGAAVLVPVSYVVLASSFRGAPSQGGLAAFDLAARPGPVSEAPSLGTAAIEFYSERSAALIASGVASGLAFVLAGYALLVLARATQARTDRFPRIAAYVPMVGGVLYGIYLALRSIGRALDFERYLDGPRTVEATQEIGRGDLAFAAEFIGLVGGLAIALAFVLVGLNAMRVGLLTRFMGVLAILSGGLFIFRISGDFPVVQAFWLGALGALFLGRWPGGVPPAWRTGRAEPWPTQQELREARDRARAERAPAPAAEPAAAVAGTGVAHPSSNKRKRKRRS